MWRLRWLPRFLLASNHELSTRTQTYFFLYRTGIGITGSEQTIFYAEVTEAMRENAGGGNQSEGELIDTVEIPVSKARDFIFDESHVKPTGCAFAVMWFIKEKYKPTFLESLRENSFEISVMASGISILAMLTALSIHVLR